MLCVHTLYNIHSVYSMVNMNGNSTHWYGESCNIFQATVFPTNICVEETCEYPWSWYAGLDIKGIPPKCKYCSYLIVWCIKQSV